jgi:hypothetical protein
MNAMNPGMQLQSMGQTGASFLSETMIYPVPETHMNESDKGSKQVVYQVKQHNSNKNTVETSPKGELA